MGLERGGGGGGGGGGMRVGRVNRQKSKSSLKNPLKNGRIPRCKFDHENKSAAVKTNR